MQRKKIVGLPNRPGAATRLTKEEEASIAAWILDWATKGMCLTQAQVSQFVVDFIEKYKPNVKLGEHQTELSHD